MSDNDFTTAAREEGAARARRVVPGDSGAAWSARMPMVEQFKQGAVWARDHLAAQEPTDAEVGAAARAILAFEGETEETAHGDLYDAAWDHARAALAAARAVRQEKR